MDSIGGYNKAVEYINTKPKQTGMRNLNSLLLTNLLKRDILIKMNVLGLE